MSKEPGGEVGGAPEAKTPGDSQTQRQIQLDDSKAIACYANFCRVTGTPEEVILDMGLNAQPFATQQDPVHVTQRIIVNYYTAKRMLFALQHTVQRHEAAFGVLETDIQKRAQRATTR